jgi:hypothetical protein
MSGAMETMTQPMWDAYMDTVHDSLKPEERARPEGVKELPAFVVRSHVGYGSQEPSPSVDLFPSWYKKGNTNSSAVIDKVSNKLATDCTPSLAKETANNAQANKFSGDIFHNKNGLANYSRDGIGSSSAGSTITEKDDVHHCDDAKPYVQLSLADCNSDKTVCRFRATYKGGTHPLSSSDFPGTVNLMIDGRTVQTINISSNGGHTFSYKVDSSGSHKASAQIIDSVLYDYTSNSVSFTGTSKNDNKITLNVSGNTFTWNSISGGAPYSLCTSSDGGSNYDCQQETSPAHRSVPGPPALRKAYVSSSNGKTSNTISGF